MSRLVEHLCIESAALLPNSSPKTLSLQGYETKNRIFSKYGVGFSDLPDGFPLYFSG